MPCSSSATWLNYFETSLLFPIIYMQLGLHQYMNESYIH